jgi:putative CRISPR-associated protein (TIGR02619 family)
MTPAPILLCTVGTSLFRPNLLGLAAALRDGSVSDAVRPVADDLVRAHAAADWPAVARLLGQLPPSERLCGAEINSIASMIEHQHVAPNCGLFFFHSDTDDGRDIAVILRRYFQACGHAPVETIAIPDLQDLDPRRFRTRGLRNLARALCRVIHARSPAACAINATGGYKAQIAVAVLLGQALSVPVFYKHEQFPEIIAFPPMPVALDFELWMKASGLLFDLERSSDPVPAADHVEDLDERCESLIERVTIDGDDYLELSPVGQIFHDTFREHFRSSCDQVLPPAVPLEQKKEPKCDHGHLTALPALKRFMERVTAEVPQVARCATFYHHPDLPRRPYFRPSSHGIEGIWSDGRQCVKFRVDTRAETPAQQVAVVAALNVWLDQQR